MPHPRTFQTQSFSAQDGQTLPEYAVVISLIAVTAAMAFALLGDGIGDVLTTVAGILG